MTTRITAGAFLVCGEKILLMKRGLHKKLGAGMWAGIGGHLELRDIENPRALNTLETCLREVREEAGIEKEAIRNLRLRYIAARKADGELRLHYHYFGELEKEIPLPFCDEGEFFWVAKAEVRELPMTTSVGAAVRHWLENPESSAVFFVAVNPAGDSATISEI